MAQLRIVHLFPDVLRFYGDGGNVMTLVDRAEARSISTSVVGVRVGEKRLPPADLILIGGGQDREQITVAAELERLGDQLRDLVAEGTALLAVCGGFQNLGTKFRTSFGEDLACPALFPVATDGSSAGRRIVGPVVAEVHRDLIPVGGIRDAAAVAMGDEADRAEPPAHRTVVGFENHLGRTVLEVGARPFATVEIGQGNNGHDQTEGVLLLPGEGGLRGLRIGTYLHGPLLPRNPHIADALLSGALARGDGPVELRPLDDRLEWVGHDAACARLRATAHGDRLIPTWAHRAIDPIRALIGY
jgi:CobQ-like glutamine amidotransferase family enzyme